MRILQLFIATTLISLTAHADLWSENLDKAASWAKAQNKYVLVDFSGSDWCGWCKKLDGEVFSQKEFQDYAKDNLICVLIDFPRDKPLPREQVEQNFKLQEKFGVTGYPTIFILGPDGSTVAKTGYRSGGAQAYVDYLRQLIDQHREAQAPVSQ